MTSTTVVHLIGVLDRGGAEIRLLEELTERRKLVRLPPERHLIIGLAGTDGALDDRFRSLGVEVVPRRLSWHFPIWFLWFLRSERTSHVHSHVQMASGYFLVLARLAGVPRRIGHLHTVGDDKPLTSRRRLYLAGARVGLALAATDIITVSAAVRDAVFARDPWLSRRARVLFDRVDATRYRPALIEEGPVGVPSSGVAILVVGRVGTDKNPRRAVAIAARLTERAAVGPVSIRFAGRVTAEDRRAVEDLATALGIGPEVQLLGDRDDVPELMASSTLLLSTSLLEGIPGVVLEAAAAGLPAVVSAIGPSEEAAAHLRGVVPIPLEADDDTWCDVIEDVIAARSDRLTRAAIRADFDRSPFALTCDQAELDALWSAPASSLHAAAGGRCSEQ